jgi:hypothetical protein
VRTVSYASLFLIKSEFASVAMPPPKKLKGTTVLTSEPR